MHLTKPAGCAFQVFGFLIALTGLGLIPQGSGKSIWGIILLVLGGWMFIRGRRTPEINKDKAPVNKPADNTDLHKKIAELESRLSEQSNKADPPPLPDEKEPEMELPEKDEQGRYIIPE